MKNQEDDPPKGAKVPDKTLERVLNQCPIHPPDGKCVMCGAPLVRSGFCSQCYVCGWNSGCG